MQYADVGCKPDLGKRSDARRCRRQAIKPRNNLISRAIELRAAGNEVDQDARKATFEVDPVRGTRGH
jgi:hypothetical protein